MRYHICALILLLVATTALAVPAPKDGWDRPTDPDNDCKIAVKDSTVTMELPGTYHDLSPKRNCFNAPCLLRDVEGDFIMQVRVCAQFRPSAKSSVDSEDPMVAAGLVLMSVEKNYWLLEYKAYRRQGEKFNLFGLRARGEQLGTNAELSWTPEGPMPGEKDRRKQAHPKQSRSTKEEQVCLRFERQGNSIRTAVSRDGKTWTSNIRLTDLQNLPPKFKAGLAAYSTSTEPFKVRFDQFKLTRGGKKDK